MQVASLLRPALAANAILGIDGKPHLSHDPLVPGSDLLESVDAKVMQALLRQLGNASHQGEIIPPIRAITIHDAHPTIPTHPAILQLVSEQSRRKLRGLSRNSFLDWRGWNR